MCNRSNCSRAETAVTLWGKIWCWRLSSSHGTGPYLIQFRDILEEMWSTARRWRQMSVSQEKCCVSYRGGYHAQLVTNLADGGDEKVVFCHAPLGRSCFAACLESQSSAVWQGWWNSDRINVFIHSAFLNFFDKLIWNGRSVSDRARSPQHTCFSSLLSPVCKISFHGKMPTSFRQWKYPKYQKCNKAWRVLEGSKLAPLAEFKIAPSLFFSSLFPTYLAPLILSVDL